jgi:acyl carrier protein
VRPDVVLPRIIELAREVAGGDRARGGASVLGAETRLAEGGLWLDSLGLVELIVACEHAFDIAFEEGDVTSRHLATVGSLAALVGERLTTPRRSSTDGGHRA